MFGLDHSTLKIAGKVASVAAAICMLLLILLFTYHNQYNVISANLLTPRRGHTCTQRHPATAPVDPDCVIKAPLKSYSQSREDLALLYNYFASPLKCNGVFVEIGALNGITFSNTKLFEDTFNWTGVLIEGHPNTSKELMENRPHTTNFAEAVCEEGQNTVEFVAKGAVGGIKEFMSEKHKAKFLRKTHQVVTVPCRPVGAMLREVGVTHIDFFSLDVEGAELVVLKTMDWTIPTRIFLVEMGRGQERDRELIDYIHSKGFRNATWEPNHWCTHTCIYSLVFENVNYQY